MCGIAGVIGADLDITPALARLRHRGPDGERVAHAAGASFGHTWLRILGRAPTPAPCPQPVGDGRFLLVFNGEIVDWERMARAHDLPATSDADLLFGLLRRHGEAALPWLNGMFALAFWDAATGTGFLARDAAGIKPLVWAERDGAVLFASETAALRAIWRAPVDEDAVARWMTLPAFSGDDPPFSGVASVPAGHLVRLGGPPTVERWFFADTTPVRDADAFLDELRATLRTVVTETGAWHLPTGLLLSGGLDSSLIAAIARPDRAWQVRFDPGPVEGDLSFDDDGPWAERVASALDLPLTPVHVPRASLPARITRIARRDAHLPAWEQQLSQDALFGAVDTPVVLVGDCADETWAGYHFLLRPEVRPIDGVLRFFRADARAALLHPRLRRTEPLAQLRAALPEDPHARIRARWLPRLMHNGDLHSMTYGVEARVPFGDARLLRLAARCPEALATRDGWEKWPLRATAPLPPDVAWRRKSALPKDQGAGEVLRAATLDAVRRGGPVTGWLDADRLLARLTDPAPLTEAERSIAFCALALDAWAAEHAG